MPKHVLITGATGLIGLQVAKTLISRGDKVTIFSHSLNSAQSKIPGASKYVKWTPEDAKDWSGYLEGQDAVIHLSGAPVMAKRWTGSYKAEILSSRQYSTHALVKVIGQSDKKPEVFICASAIGYYGTAKKGETFTEKSPAGSDFLAAVCKVWEREASVVENYGVRRVSLRTGIVLDLSGGALAKMITPFRFFAGGPLGQGKQGFPWIHIDDVTSIILLALDNRSLNGPVNLVAPEKISMNEFSSTLGNLLNRPSWLKVPAPLLKIIVGEGAETIAKTPFVESEVLKNFNYKFKFENSEQALKNILQRT